MGKGECIDRFEQLYAEKSGQLVLFVFFTVLYADFGVTICRQLLDG